MNRKLIEIVWSDAAHHAPGDWIEQLPTDFTVTVTTVGWHVATTDTHLVVAQSIDSSGNLTGVFSIVKTNILSKRRLQHRPSNA